MQHMRAEKQREGALAHARAGIDVVGFAGVRLLVVSADPAPVVWIYLAATAVHLPALPAFQGAW